MFTNTRYELCDIRIKMFKILMELYNLKKEHRSLKKKTSTVAPPRSKKLFSSPADTQEDRIGLYAWKFAIMNEYSVPLSAFMVQHPTGLRSDDTNRWVTKETALQGIVLELYEELPPDLHPMLSILSSFCTKVSFFPNLINVISQCKSCQFLNKLNTFRCAFIHQF